MKSIKEIVLASPYRGSEKTYEMVKAQIAERWGKEVADEFNPHTDAMPYSSFAAYGYKIRKGERALKSVTFIDVLDSEGRFVKKIRRSVNLFHKLQVEKIS